MQNPDRIRIAVGVGPNRDFFTKNHFGESNEYLIYDFDIEQGKVEFVESRPNLSHEERMHGDPKKAKEVSSIISDVHIILAYALGQNITRMRKKYVIVISRFEKVKDALERLPSLKNDILGELQKEKGTDKKVLYLRE